MDVNFFAKWLSFLFFSLATFQYLSFFLKNTFLLNVTEKNLKAIYYKLGAFNLFVSIQMIAGLYYVLKLRPNLAAAHVGIAGLTMLCVALLEFFTNPEKNKKEYLIQALLPFLGFAFLSVHIIYHILNRS